MQCVVSFREEIILSRIWVFGSLVPEEKGKLTLFLAPCAYIESGNTDQALFVNLLPGPYMVLRADGSLMEYQLGATLTMEALYWR